MKLPKLTNLSVTGTTVGDVHFPKVAALLPFDGTNGATSTTDLSNNTHTVTFGGDAQISTAQSKFGGSSLSLDGNGDYVDLPQSTNQLTSDDFTIEFWFRINSGAGSSTYGILGSFNQESGTYKGFYFFTTSARPQVYFQAYCGSDGWAEVNKDQGTRTALSNNTWYHVAVTRNGSTWRLFLNGTQEDSITLDSSITDAGSTTRLGSGGPIETSGWFNGYIEDLRITKGVARYTSNFTAPTTAHLTSAGDVNKHIVVNSDADGVAIGTGGINQARIAKAWVRFDGSGTPAIAESYNFSSITDNGTGNYTANFSTNLSSANYSATGGVGMDGVAGNPSPPVVFLHTLTASSIKVYTRYAASSGADYYDYDTICLQIFGN